MKQSINVIAFLVAATITVIGQEPSARPAQGTASAKATSAEAVFMRTAAMDGLAEVEHGRLAIERGASADVKQFAQRMVDDHSKAGEELKSLATQKHVTLPTDLDQKHRAMQDKLAKLKGEAFDKAYMSHMVIAHQQAVALFQREAKGGKDPDVKAWAAKTLPVLQEHYKSAGSHSMSSKK